MGEAVDKAYRTIRDGIMRGAYPQGAHMTAQDLASAIGLSRTPIREAMRRLHAEGLIQIIPNRGAFVSQWSQVEIEGMYDLRVLLEGFAAECAARHATEEQIAELRHLAVEMRRLVRKEPAPLDQVAQNNDRFHKTILRASGNPRLGDLLSSIVEMPLVLSTFRRYSAEELRRSADQHVELVSAIEMRDPAWARSVMAAHILSARRTLLQSIALADDRGVDG
ncbi:MAG: GntR family transcriptional regulator [Hyphomonadaceae bacterium]|nr:GntR family transcriptional regulator [Hyphomonadaceae bacterium]